MRVRVTVEVTVGVCVVVGVAVWVTVGARVWVEVAGSVSEAIRIGLSVEELQADSSMANSKNKQM